MINKHTIQISPQKSQRGKNVLFSDNKFIIYKYSEVLALIIEGYMY